MLSRQLSWNMQAIEYATDSAVILYKLKTSTARHLHVATNCVL